MQIPKTACKNGFDFLFHLLQIGESMKRWGRCRKCTRCTGNCPYFRLGKYTARSERWYNLGRWIVNGFGEKQTSLWTIGTKSSLRSSSARCWHCCFNILKCNRTFQRRYSTHWRSYATRKIVLEEVLLLVLLFICHFIWRLWWFTHSIE